MFGGDDGQIGDRRAIRDVLEARARRLIRQWDDLPSGHGELITVAVRLLLSIRRLRRVDPQLAESIDIRWRGVPLFDPTAPDDSVIDLLTWGPPPGSGDDAAPAV